MMVQSAGAKRIAILHYSAPPLIGGVESTMGDHARLLAARGYSVRLVAGRGGPAPAGCEMRLVPLAGSRHRRVESVQGELARGQVTAAFHALVADLRRELAAALEGCDVCLAHNMATLNKNLALTTALHDLAAGSGPRLVAWCHDFAWTDPLYRPALHEGWPWDLLRTAWPGVSYVVVSRDRQGELAGLLGVPAEAISVITPGIDPAAFLGLGRRVAGWMDQLGLKGARPLMLLPARVTRRKNIELAVRITAALAGRGLSPKLVVMGPLGPHNPANAAYLTELKALAAELGAAQSVVFLQEHGHVSDAARRDLYLTADLLLFPSLREGFGIPVLEAGAARLPVFCSDIPPFRESAGDSAHYFGLDEEPGAIAGRITAFLAGDDASRLRQRVLSEYSWPRIVESKIVPLIEGRQPEADQAQGAFGP